MKIMYQKEKIIEFLMSFKINYQQIIQYNKFYISIGDNCYENK